MYIFIIIWAVFSFLLLRRFHRTFMYYVVFSVFLIDGIGLKYSPPALSVNLALQIQVVIYGFLHNKVRSNNFPLYNSFVFWFVVYGISVVFSHMPFFSSLTYICRNVFTLFIIIIFWNEYNYKRDFQYFHNAILITAIIFISYTFVEYILQENPILNFEKSLIPAQFQEGKVYVTDVNNIRFGSIRCQSLFSHSISLGVVSYVYINYFIVYLGFGRKNQMNKTLVICLIPLLVWCIIVSGARSPIIALIVSLLAYVKLNSLNNKILVILGCLLLCFGLFLGLFNVGADLVMSLFSEDASSDLKGSSMDGRLLQFKTSLNALYENPLIGFGARGREYAVTQLKLIDLLGSESIWLKTIVEFGLLGCSAICYTFIKTYQYGKGKMGKVGVFFTISWMVVNTMTTIPNVGWDFYYTILIVMSSLYGTRLMTITHRFH